MRSIVTFLIDLAYQKAACRGPILSCPATGAHRRPFRRRAGRPPPDRRRRHDRPEKRPAGAPRSPGQAPGTALPTAYTHSDTPRASACARAPVPPTGARARPPCRDPPPVAAAALPTGPPPRPVSDVDPSRTPSRLASRAWHGAAPAGWRRPGRSTPRPRHRARDSPTKCGAANRSGQSDPAPRRAAGATIRGSPAGRALIHRTRSPIATPGCGGDATTSCRSPHSSRLMVFSLVGR